MNYPWSVKDFFTFVFLKSGFVACPLILIGENGYEITVWRRSSWIKTGQVKFNKLSSLFGSFFAWSQYVLNYCLDFGIVLAYPLKNCNWNLSLEIDSDTSYGLCDYIVITKGDTILNYMFFFSPGMTNPRGGLT